jgi:hypothetical protein
LKVEVRFKMKPENRDPLTGFDIAVVRLSGKRAIVEKWLEAVRETAEKEGWTE